MKHNVDSIISFLKQNLLDGWLSTNIFVLQHVCQVQIVDSFNGFLFIDISGSVDLFVSILDISAFKNFFTNEHLHEIRDFDNWFKSKCNKKIGFDGLMSFRSYSRASQILVQSYSELICFDGAEQKFRSQKNFFEIQKMFESANIACLCFCNLLLKMKEGVSEKFCVYEIEKFFLDHGGRPSFPPIVCFGENSKNPHHSVTDTRLKRGDVVLIDLGVLLNGYSSDLTRTFSFYEPMVSFYNIWGLVLKAKTEAEKCLFANTSLKKIEEKSREIIGNYNSKFIHSIGHGLGYQVHEAPFSSDTLLPSMLFTVEPGVYLDAFGVRLEDSWMMTNFGALNLTPLPFFPLYDMYMDWLAK